MVSGRRGAARGWPLGVKWWAHWGSSRGSSRPQFLGPVHAGNVDRSLSAFAALAGVLKFWAAESPHRLGPASRSTRTNQPIPGPRRRHVRRTGSAPGPAVGAGLGPFGILVAWVVWTRGALVGACPADRVSRRGCRRFRLRGLQGHRAWAQVGRRSGRDGRFLVGLAAGSGFSLRPTGRQLASELPGHVSRQPELWGALAAVGPAVHLRAGPNVFQLLRHGQTRWGPRVRPRIGPACFVVGWPRARRDRVGRCSGRHTLVDKTRLFGVAFQISVGKDC